MEGSVQRLWLSDISSKLPYTFRLYSGNQIIGMGSPFQHYSGSKITDMGPSFQLYELGTTGNINCGVPDLRTI
jgi:hypothetical protein